MSMVGKTLGSFQCTALLGKGGMGEVYKAKDQKLGRDVAIKVLPEEFAKDADRVARFQREAKLLASLNHNNIASIYGLEESDGTHFLVLELIEGDTLADRLKRGAIPTEESLKLALQIAEALEAAHEKGVIHRDLKPANIKVTPDGKVKVLDFGLAKAFAGDQAEVNLSHSPTLSAAATQQGVILGTAAYMSPEQARGENVDKKADIWAFGVVLFEMLTGCPLFEGNNVSQTLASVIKSEPEWQTLPPNLHPRIKFLLERCLNKEPKNRYSGISDARVDIQQVLADPSGLFVQPVMAAKHRMRPRTIIPWIAVSVILSLTAIGVALWYLGSKLRAGPVLVGRFEHILPEDQYFTNTGRTVVTVSNDGSKLVYVANNQLYLRNLNELTAIPIQGTNENPVAPVFSNDGKWIVYFSVTDRKLKRIAISGGAPVPLCDAAYPFGTSWGEDGAILFGQPEGVMRISPNGGTPELLVKTEQGEQVDEPQLLPGGKWLLFAITNSIGLGRWDTAQVVAQSLETGERKVLVSGGCDAHYVPTGHLVYALGSDLFADTFDVDRLEVSGLAIPVVQEIQRAVNPGTNTGSANYAFSDGGTLVYASGVATANRKLVWVDRHGTEEPLEAQPNTYLSPTISPDGTKVALSIETVGKIGIWIWDLIRKNLIRLTFDETSGILPVWTLDNQRIIFSSSAAESYDIYWKNADGTGEIELLFSDSESILYSSDLSANGNSLVIVEDSPIGGFNIAVGLLEKDRVIKPLLQSESNEYHAMISLDGQWIAYVSDESGQSEVFVRPFPDADAGKWQVSTNGGDSPIWSRDGRELFYRNGNAVMVVSIEKAPTFRAQIPKTLFQGTYFYPTGGSQWDISPDGKQFLMIKEIFDDEFPGGTRQSRINIVLNWFEELKDRVPAD